MSSRLTLAACLATALLAPAASTMATESGRHAVTAEDLLALAEVRDPQISPDGEWVAYTVATIDLDEDKGETAIWAVPTGDGEPWRLTAPGTSGSRPRWSPDSERLAFLSSRSAGDEDAKSQVWVFDLRGGDAQPLTKIVQGVDSFDWSPDGRRLLLTIQDPKPEDLLDEAEKAKKKPEPHVIDRLQFKQDYTGYLDRRRSHLYVLDLEHADDEGQPAQITSGDFDDSEAVWSPDGKLIAFVSNRSAEPDGNDNTDLWIVAAYNNDQGKTLRQITTNNSLDYAPSWSPDGNSLVYVTGRSPELMWYALEQLAVVTLDGDSRLLTAKLDRNVSAPEFSADGKSVLFSLEDSGARHLAEVNIKSGRLERPVAGELAMLGFSQSKDGTIAYLASNAESPREVYLLENGSSRQLTSVNQELLATLELGRVDNVQFASADGTEIEAFITFPPDYDPHLTYPTILWIHGGPASQYDHRFNGDSQLFAASGYLVVRANPRGSTGYGEKFCAALFADWGNKDFEDVMAAVDFAVEQGYTDPDRLGVGGWSYGGILTNYVITQTDRFEAAISGASEVLYVANYGHDHYQRFWEKELGLPWENRELWEKLSPFNRVQEVVTPTLVIGGALDWNVPIQNSEQLYQALKRLGVETQLVVYPGEHHGIRKPSFRLDRWGRYLGWFDRYVKGVVGGGGDGLE